MPVNTERLNIGLIKRNLVSECREIVLFDSIDSTNNWLLEQGECGDVCLAEMQTSGKGRRGNPWVSPDSGNIYLSLCWCFEKIPEHWSLLGLVMGIAVAETLQQNGLQGHGIKWPNDILWKDRKMSGILLESRDMSGRVVIGIGLNITMPVAISRQISQPWVSMNEALGGALISRNRLVANLIDQLHTRLADFDQLGFNEFLNEWQKWDILSGRKVSFMQNDQKIVGNVCGIDKNGRIGILQQKGETCFYSSAEIKRVSQPE